MAQAKTDTDGMSDGSYGGYGTQNTSTKPRESADTVTDKLSGMADKVGEQADAGIDKAAETLGQASERIRQRAQEQGGVPAQVGAKVADGLDLTTEYLESHDTSQIMDDVEKYVKEHPLAAVAGAVIGGFVLARVLR